jgi:hypothetical protein
MIEAVRRRPVNADFWVHFDDIPSRIRDEKM